MNVKKLFGIIGIVAGIIYALIVIYILLFDSKELLSALAVLILVSIEFVCGSLLYKMSKKKTSSKTLFTILVIIEIGFLFPLFVAFLSLLGYWD